MRYFLLDSYKIVIFVLLLWCPVKIVAQQPQGGGREKPSIPYTFKSENSTFNYLTGGEVVPTLSSDNIGSGKLPIGFSFQFGCEIYYDFYASSNGTISFNFPFFVEENSIVSLYPNNLTLLAPLWDDLSGVGGVFSYRTTGVAPNRVLTAEWKNWKWAYNASSPVISFQVKLYEGTNSIEYIYNQEPNLNTNTSAASIGIFNGIDLTVEAKQLWLHNSGVNPVASINFISNIDKLPASGQLYRFIRNDNEDSCKASFYGQTVINKTGGTNADDGLRITLSGAANMQVRRKNSNQIYSSGNNLVKGTSDLYGVPGSTHGIVLSVGNTYFTGGTLLLTTLPRTRLEVVSSTQQSHIEYSLGHFKNEIKLAAVKNGLTYDLTVKYVYNLPDNYFFIDYSITIPSGNTEEVKLAHGWDSYLEGKDVGPGFVSGTAPNLVVGVTREPSYEAFEYIGGVPWSGYFSAYYGLLNANLGSEMTFKNTINPGLNIDNGIGISMNFGTTSGSYTSNNKVIFSCAAGDEAPILVNKGVICQDLALDLNSLVTSSKPFGTVLVWKDAKGVVVIDPTAVTTSGTYTAYYYSEKYNCVSPSSSIVITLDHTCGVCYKPGIVIGTQAGSLTIISSLDRKNHPAVNQRNGALILESKEKGFAISKVASPEITIAIPVEGMLVYDTISNCLKLYNGTTWNCIEQTCIDKIIE
ncbi:hypothetical protein LNQ49_01590 [Flavobacterium sp. F-65]|uniref:IgGFc-binding protein N-terminal domain-containing protein n=1 Tax=Flavobacterium pisciphilum TaxID=2893755 RepID=A0ABS8MNE9_9FLAO|nr:hypothetical protein [Flavobacterium sp. F-65]MCC9070296.1 hypothetical protein [Flavobacterium sp. F-65]